MRDEDGEIIGLDDSRETEERVAGILQNIEPMVNTEITREQIGESELLFISVDQAEDTSRSWGGRYYKRVGTTIQEMAPDEVAQFRDRSQ